MASTDPTKGYVPNDIYPMQRDPGLPPEIGGKPQPGSAPPMNRDPKLPPITNGSQPDTDVPMQRDPQLPPTVDFAGRHWY